MCSLAPLPPPPSALASAPPRFEIKLSSKSKCLPAFVKTSEQSREDRRTPLAILSPRQAVNYLRLSSSPLTCCLYPSHPPAVSVASVRSRRANGVRKRATRLRICRRWANTDGTTRRHRAANFIFRAETLLARSKRNEHACTSNAVKLCAIETCPSASFIKHENAYRFKSRVLSVAIRRRISYSYKNNARKCLVRSKKKIDRSLTFVFLSHREIFSSKNHLLLANGLFDISYCEFWEF